MKFLDLVDDMFPEWHARAACNGRDPSLWFPDAGPGSGEDRRARATAEARRICIQECKVRLQCKQAANENAEVWGVWAGDDREGWRKGDVA